MPRALSHDRARISTRKGLDQQALHQERERMGGGVYQWETLADAKAFYAGAWRDGVVEPYGMPPQIEFFEVFALTDNDHGTVELFKEPPVAR